MTLPQVYRLQRYWKKHPPTHILTAAMARYRPRVTPADGEAMPATKISGGVGMEEKPAPIGKTGMGMAALRAAARNGEIKLETLVGLA